jgi:putative hydroxymethylpyrimidine transport system substrate-binding protein
MIRRRAALALPLLALPALARGQAAREPLTLLLDWFINPDHAPIMVAQERGDFARAGLEVRIIAPADPNDPPRLVAARRGDIGIFYQMNLHLAVDQGLPLARVGTLVSTPLATLTVLRDGRSASSRTCAAGASATRSPDSRRWSSARCWRARGCA